jgi:transposase-like protein
VLIFPINELMDEQACYDFLLSVLHPEGLHCCNGHALPANQAPHDRHRAPIMDYRCRQCGSVYNIFSNTIWSKSHYSCSKIVLIVRGIAQGVPTKHLAEELEIDRSHLLSRRHQIQELIGRCFSPLSSAGCGSRSRRNVSEFWGKRGQPSRPIGSSSAACQQVARTRNVGQ